jgi:Tfp pilus assembly protein PilF
MRPRTNRPAHFHLTVKGLALWGFFAFSTFSLHAQGTSRLPSGAARYGSTFPGLESDPLAVIQSQPAAPPRVMPQAETISVHDLLVPASAIKEFQRSEKAVRSGDFRSAAGHLQKAILIEPKFVQAHNNLGASYIQLNEYESAVTEFQMAISLDGKIQEPYRNLGLGLFLLRRYPEAELAARQALKLDPQRTAGYYTLGRILAAEGGNSSEAEELLRQVVPTIPEARLPLAQALLNQGATDRAANELRAYISSSTANPAKKQAVQCWLAQMTKSPARLACTVAKTSN